MSMIANGLDVAPAPTVAAYQMVVRTMIANLGSLPMIANHRHDRVVAGARTVHLAQAAGAVASTAATAMVTAAVRECAAGGVKEKDADHKRYEQSGNPCKQNCHDFLLCLLCYGARTEPLLAALTERPTAERVRHAMIANHRWLAMISDRRRRAMIANHRRRNWPAVIANHWPVPGMIDDRVVARSRTVHCS